MPTPFESASLNLQLFALRREPVLREARAWFLRDFTPDSFEELVSLVSGDRNASFRMVLGYWDMAASLVTTGAIDADAFRAAHGELFATFSKIHPFLAELRAASGEPDFCKQLESVTLGAPDAAAILTRRRDAIRRAKGGKAPKMASLSRVSPELPVHNMAEALQHYETVLGFDVAMTMPEGDYAIVERDDVAVHLFQSASAAHAPGSIHIFTTGLDALFAELPARGARVAQTIVRQPWGNRDFRVVDCSGNVIKFTEPLDERA